MQPLRKAVIPAAGKGTRLEPLTLAIPKEMIRVGKKPVIHHVIDIVKSAGVTDILIITGWRKGALLDYVGSGKTCGVTAFYRVQDEQLGLGHAILQAKSWVNGENFMVAYGDTYVPKPPNMNELVDFHQKKKAAATLVIRPVKDPTRYGIVKMDHENRIIGMIEKPSQKEAENYKVGNEFYSILGIGIFDPKIFDFIGKTPPGKNNEIQLTDALDMMRNEGHPLYGYVYKGDIYDVGTWEALEEIDKLSGK